MATGPSIPSVPASDPATYAFNQALKQQVELLAGTRNSTSTPAVTATVTTVTSVPTASISLTNLACTLQADSSGNVSSFATANGILHVYSGGVDITNQCVLSEVSQTNCTGQINTAADTPIAGQPLGYYQITALSANSGQMLLQALFGTLALQATFNISKALAGPTGAAGTGTGALSLQLSNIAMVLPAYANETVQSFGVATGLARMFSGSTEVTASSTFSSVGSSCTGTINTAANTPVAGQPIGFYQITAIFPGTTTASFAISGTYNSVKITQIVNITLAMGGFEIVATLPNTNLFQGRVVFYTVDNKLYRYSGSAWITWVQASDVTGQINAAQIQDGIITTAKLLPGLSPVILVTTLPAPGIAGRIVYLTADSKLYRDTGTVWTTSIASTDLAGQIPASQLVANSITAGQIQAGAITTNAMVANSITGDRISAGTLDAAKIAALSITAAQLQANSVTTLAMAANSITGDRIAAGTLDAAKITSNTISALQIAAGAVTTASMTANTITGDRITAGTLDASKIQTGSITAASGVIGDFAVNTLQLAGNAVSVPGGAQATIAMSTLGAMGWYAAVVAPAFVTDGTFPVFINAQAPIGQTWFQTFTVSKGSGYAAGGLLGIIARVSGIVTIGTQITPVAQGGAMAGPSGPMNAMWMDVPPPGTWSYVLGVYGGTMPLGSGTPANTAMSKVPAGSVISVMGLKR